LETFLILLSITREVFAVVSYYGCSI